MVKAWKEEVMIPTYGVGKPEKNPMFLEKRVYQGSSGVVYPHPVIEKILDKKEDRPYEGVFLENEYLKIMILPQLGGRVQMAFDKIRQRHFIYYNRVIKPALVGLTGPWISGGIEFNWPQHHRPTTFEPLDYTIEENEDGSKTVWVNEVEVMSRTKGMAGFTLYPGRAYLEVKGRLYNRTPFPQTFLWWANPAVKVNEQYQTIFPPDVHAVFDHGRRDVSSFPIATGTYYKVNYAPGTDISGYKNIPVPTSYMAVHSQYDFIGGYEHDTQAGVLHVADHHISPGKKQWTWGNGDFGHAWDRNLTDEDGPYIEIMTGVFTDNQPDFSWIQPNEEKQLSQYFLPYSGVGRVKNATKEAALNLEPEGGQARIKVYVTANYPKARVILYAWKKVLWEVERKLSPEVILDETVTLPEKNIPFEALRLEVKDGEGRLLVGYQAEGKNDRPIPPPALAAKDPQEIESTELLYLNGLHIEQYRHATRKATDYYQEALRRDPGDARNNNALGLWYLRRGQFAKAVPFFRAAIGRLTLRNPNPYDGEPYYHLGSALKILGQPEEARDAFYKATWNGAWQSSAFFALARIATAEGHYEEALEMTEKALAGNYYAPDIRHLKAVILRKTGRVQEALAVIQESLATDPFNYGCYFERYLPEKDHHDPDKASATLLRMKELMHGQPQTWLEYALDYAQAGCYTEAAELLKCLIEDQPEAGPMVYYMTGWCFAESGDQTGAAEYFHRASGMRTDYCFPNRIEEILILQKAITFNPSDARAWYYLGNLWYDKRQYPEAIGCWERSAALDDSFPTVFRNLSLAYHNHQKEEHKSLQAMERAFLLDRSDARVLMELDQLDKKMNRPPAERLERMEIYLPLVEDRDDLYLERVTLYNQLGRYEEAQQLLAVRQFHPWEGGEGKVIRQYLVCHIALAKQAITGGSFRDALDLLSRCEQYPHHLGEGKLFGTPENDIHYLQGLAYRALGETEKAKQRFLKAAKGSTEPVQAIFYNDPQPDQIFYHGLARMQLEEAGKGREIFERFIRFADEHAGDHIRIDYFAVSLPDLLVFDQDLDEKNRVFCCYLKGLGKLGLGNYAEAENDLREVLSAEVNHQGAITHLGMIAFLSAAAPGEL